MKKLLSALLAVFFLFTASSGMSNAATAKDAEVQVKTSIDVKIGTSTNAVFLLETEGISVNEAELRDESGKKVAAMHDSGTKGDARKNDGTYSAKLSLKSDTCGIVKYTAYIDGKAYREYEVNYYKDFTKHDEAQMQAVYDGINAIESEMEAANASDTQIFNAVLEYIRSCDCIVNTEVENSTIAYTSDAGISALYARYEDGVKGSGTPTNNAVAVTANGDKIEIKNEPVKGNESLQSWTNPNVLVVRPFRNVSGQEGFHNDRYTDAAKLLTKYTKGYITVLDNEATIPYNLLNTFWQNGFVMVDSHGLTGYGNSYICVWDGGGYTAGDVTANRVMKTNDPTHIYISGDYFQYYYEQMNIRMQNSFLYFGVCYGMTYDTLRTPFFELGAVCAYGYDNSVSMGYEGYNLLTMYPYLTTICAEDNTRTYNLEEAAAEAIKRNGDTDPYGTNGAHLKLYGDTKFVVYKPDVELTGISMLYDSVEGTVGLDCYIPVLLTPEKTVYGYSEEWTSSDPEILEIVGTRMGHAKKAGEATVYAKFTYGDNTYEASCKVTVNEVLPQSITASYSGANSQFKVGQTREISAELLPLDCGNKHICYTSNNPGTVTVDSTGKITSLRPGKAVITVYAEADPNVCTKLNITVSDAEVYKAGSEFDFESTFLISSRSSSPAIMSAAPASTDGYMQARAASKYMGYYSGNINAVCFWSFIKANGGFYIYNMQNNAYLTRGDSGSAYMSAEPLTLFDFDGTHITVKNAEDDTENTYLHYKTNTGFNFSEESGSSTKVELVKILDFTDDSIFATVTFSDNGTEIATQRVAIGDNAVAAVPDKKAGKTFLGWDKCLAEVTESFTTDALTEDGETDKIIVSFKDYDGTDIMRVELDSPGKCTPPEAPVHDGMTFKGWSENINKVTTNMTVFAMYTTGLRGDVNLDGAINTADAVTVLKSVAGIIELDNTQRQNADTNSDGSVNTADAVCILKYAAGIITEF